MSCNNIEFILYDLETRCTRLLLTFSIKFTSYILVGTIIFKAFSFTFPNNVYELICTYIIVPITEFNNILFNENLLEPFKFFIIKLYHVNKL